MALQSGAVGVAFLAGVLEPVELICPALGVSDATDLSVPSAAHSGTAKIFCADDELEEKRKR